VQQREQQHRLLRQLHHRNGLVLCRHRHDGLRRAHRVLLHRLRNEQDLLRAPQQVLDDEVRDLGDVHQDRHREDAPQAAAAVDLAVVLDDRDDDDERQDVLDRRADVVKREPERAPQEDEQEHEADEDRGDRQRAGAPVHALRPQRNDERADQRDQEWAQRLQLLSTVVRDAETVGLVRPEFVPDNKN